MAAAAADALIRAEVKEKSNGEGFELALDCKVGREKRAYNCMFFVAQTSTSGVKCQNRRLLAFQ